MLHSGCGAFVILLNPKVIYTDGVFNFNFQIIRMLRSTCTQVYKLKLTLAAVVQNKNLDEIVFIVLTKIIFNVDTVYDIILDSDKIKMF